MSFISINYTAIPPASRRKVAGEQGKEADSDVDALINVTK